MSGHHHHSDGLNAALILTAIFAVVELVGGLISGSLALLADAGHMFSDVAALGIASAAAYIARKPAHQGMTYGYGRAKILAAQINGLTLCFLAGWIAWEAFGRMTSPPEVNGSIMFVIALVGLVINLIVLRWLHGADKHKTDLNTKAAYWHVVGDALGSVAALVGGIVILFTGWMLIDPILSFVESGILAWGGWRLIRQTTFVLMDAVPDGISLENIASCACQVEGVDNIHHIHVWRLPDGELAISAHIDCKNIANWSDMLPELQRCMATDFQITHATFQPEEGRCATDHQRCHS
ncbi:MAG: cation diffusion facilitator family transporter [Mariprofundaceae bacterium]